MTYPTIPTVGAGRVLSVLATSPSGTHTSPNLSSLTKNAGDTLLAIVIIYDGNSTNAEFSAWGGGFTELPVGGDNAGTATMGIGVAYKTSTGAETGTFTVTTADTSTNDSAFFLLSIPAGNTATAPEAGSFTTGTAIAADPGSFDPSWGIEETLWIAVGASGETGTGGNYDGISAAPANYNNYAESGISADAVGGVEGAVAFRQLEAQSEDVGTFTLDTSNARNAALVIAVRSPTIGSSFTADATITVVTTGSFTADAVLKREQSGSATADAVISLLVSGSLTADAVLKATISGSLTADAIALGAQVGSLTTDAVLLRIQSGLLTADAIVKREQAGPLTADAEISTEPLHGFMVDAVLLKTITSSITNDSIVRVEQADILPANAILFGSTSGSISADAVQRTEYLAGFSADAVLRQGRSDGLIADAILFSSPTGTFTSDAKIVFAPLLLARRPIRSTLGGGVGHKFLTADAVLEV